MLKYTGINLYTFTQILNNMKSYSFIILTVAFFIMVTVPSLAGKKESKLNPTLTVTVRGVVLDRMTREKLAGVSIQTESNQEKIYSDPDGSFVISNLEPDNNIIKVKCISYKDKEIKLDMKSLRKGKFNVLLEPILP